MAPRDLVAKRIVFEEGYVTALEFNTGPLSYPRGCVIVTLFFQGEPFQYDALGVKPFRIPFTEKYAIEKVKPLHGTITLFGHH